MQAPGKLEQLQHSPSTGSWQDQQEPRGLGAPPEKMQRDETGAGSGAKRGERART